MVQSRAPHVDAYLVDVPDDRKVVLTRVRELCRAELEGFAEVMAYGMPTYRRDGVAEIAFASQKQSLSFYLLRGDVRDAFAERPAGQGMGKSCLRFCRPGSVDLGLVRDLLRATAATSGPAAQ
ncbi:iron chaperone [Streptomyces althioticus]|uniref:iron chaperone n=1 Tax=Streptomyces althioticus TaxID=83380 RepID=UPI0036C8E379